ncbi:MAG: hypothetical protein J6A89_03465 [Clostridia bacterium]|nr:hypothetical protein [Clostridia bacterium]
MKKIVKILLIVLSLLIISNLNYTYANEDIFESHNPVIIRTDEIDVSSFNPANYGSLDSESIIKYTNHISSTLTVLAVVMGVIALMIIGLKFIMGSPNKKADYKKHLMPIVVGIAIVVTVTTIVTILIGIGNEINENAAINQQTTLGSITNENLK